MKNRTALNKMCVDISEKMCYHVFNRRSDLGVVKGNPEFGRGGGQPPCSAAALCLSGRSLRKVGDPAVKAAYSPLIIFSCHFFSTLLTLCTSAWI